MKAIVTYSLSQEGQRESLLSGGNGQMKQTLECDRNDPLFAEVVRRGTVNTDGTVELYVSSSFGRPQTLESIISHLRAQEERAVREKEAKIESIRADTLSVLRERRTYRQEEAVLLGKDGQIVPYGGVLTVRYEYETPLWSYCADQAVIESPEAQTWLADLQTAREAALAKVLAEAREKIPAILEEKAAEERAAEEKAQAIIARKESLGGTEADYLCRIEDGALCNVPAWQNSKRGKNWFASISSSPSSPGGLARDFAEKAGGDCYYLLPSLKVGDAVEFGADYYTSSNRKKAERWYGFVVSVTDECLLLRPCATGQIAVKEGAKFCAK